MFLIIWIEYCVIHLTVSFLDYDILGYGNEFLG
jgi:hypothetical protein